MVVTVAMPLAWGSLLVPRADQHKPVVVALSQAAAATSAAPRGTDRAARTSGSRPLPPIRGDGRTAVTMQSLASLFTIPVPSTRTALVIALAWAAVSLSLCAAFVWSLRRLTRERATWTRASLHGTAVLVSDGFGPALVGFRAPEIVVPPWVMALDAPSTRMILSHELEHRRAGDSRVIICAMLLAIAMPWSPLLWWMLGRFVRAVEFDCDARVIARGVRSAQYADLLLGAWQHATPKRHIAFSAAFAERRSRLGQRVTHLLRPEPREKSMKMVTGATLSFALAAMAVAAPTPRVVTPGSASVRQSVLQRARGRLIVIDGIPRPDLTTAEQQRVEWQSRTGASEILISS